jgi:hypothetical protein
MRTITSIGQQWVLCSDSTGKYLRSDVHPMRWEDSPFDATIFDARDNREIKARVLGAITGQKLVALDL